MWPRVFAFVYVYNPYFTESVLNRYTENMRREMNYILRIEPRDESLEQKKKQFKFVSSALLNQSHIKAKKKTCYRLTY